MRYAGLTLLMLLMITACKKEEKKTDDSTRCVSAPTDPYPLTENEDLTPSYVIKFPNGYTYGGYIVFEGDYFLKKKYTSGDTITFTASYGPQHAQKSVYGPPLINADASSVDITYNDQVQTLKKKGRLCSGGNTLGYYYYTLQKADTTTTNQGLGVIYLKDNNDFRQNLIVDFPVTMEEEVNTIISTITTKTL